MAMIGAALPHFPVSVVGAFSSHGDSCKSCAVVVGNGDVDAEV